MRERERERERDRERERERERETVLCVVCHFYYLIIERHYIWWRYGGHMVDIWWKYVGDKNKQIAKGGT